ncbi:MULTISPECIES: STAS domain-containing protein [Methanobacterium]|jgi:anti-sigma B factor antagonist|uniref:STAS domain-containing protein n=1 Tax=Methanobacterium veterum TaxID=408577 RepID=A0A9E4ZYC5_9EURY|nr:MULTISPECIES: STAS domain-containing protein [Methanobacterium]MCZ3366366.1 STAS domain-containing protein [Methanobacterium veterum]MCZ3371874.1 STAS domain-containing protein [Methanobacterium veterum]
MKITEDIDDNICKLSLEGKLDAYHSTELEKCINKVIGDGCINLLLNFQRVDYISSSGLRVVLSSLKQLKKSGGKIILSNLHPYVMEVFEISGFKQIFEIYESEEEALKSFEV